MKLKVTKSEKAYVIAGFMKGKNLFNLRELGNLIREGYEMEIESTDGIDYTKETLVKIAFEDVFPPNIKNEYIQAMVDFIDISDLLLVIENGGYLSYVNRSARKAVNRTELFYNKIDEAVENLVHSTDNMEIKTYLLSKAQEIDDVCS